MIPLNADRQTEKLCVNFSNYWFDPIRNRTSSSPPQRHTPYLLGHRIGIRSLNLTIKSCFNDLIIKINDQIIKQLL